MTRLGRAVTGAVFLREARRSSRRWQTYALRFGFAAAMLLGVVLVLQTTPAIRDPARSGEIGRWLFRIYTGVQLAVVMVLAPLLVGLGVAEERDEGTLQLLVMTRLSPGQILWGKVMSRLILLVTLVIGGLPILSLIATFGGVGGWEVVNATVNTLVVALALGTIGGIAALFTGNGIGSVVLATIWGVAAYVVVPGVFATASTLDPTTAYPYLCPPWAMYHASWRGLLPAVAHLPTAWFAARFATPLFAMVTTRDDLDLEADANGDPQLADVIRAQRRVGVVALSLLPWIGVAMWLVTRGRRPAWFATVAGATIQVPVAELRVGVAYAVSVLLLLAGTGGLILLQLRAAAVARAVFGSGGGSATRSLLVRVLREFDAAFRPLRMPVWWNPVLWREVMTRGPGAGVTLARWLLVPWVGFLSLLACLGAMRGADVPLVTGALTAVAAVFVTVVTATLAFTSERDARTLPLLLNTTFHPARIVAGKLAAVALTSVPWVVIAHLLIGYGVGVAERDRAVWNQAGGCGEGLLLSGVPGARLGLTLIWTLAVWLALATIALTLAMRLRPTRVAFGANLALIVGFFLAPAVAEELVPDAIGDPLAAMWLPMTTAGWTLPGCGTPWQFPVATVGWLVVAAVAFGVLVFRLRAWARADAPG